MTAPDALFRALDRWAEEKADAPALHFVTDLSGSIETYSYGELAQWTLAAAGAYRQAGLQAGQRVLLDLQTGPGFVAALLGAWHAGLTPASVAPLGQRNGDAATLDWQHHIQALAPSAVVSADEVPSGDLIRFTSAELMAGDPRKAGPRASAEQMQYVQFSSGSTGAPKALVLGMPGISIHLESMRQHLPIPPDDHVLSWLPMYHDMGLFGTLLVVLIAGAELTLLDPSLFTRSPVLWYKLLDQQRAQGTVGPPSAIKASLELLKRRPPESLDLSSLSRWFVGSEQVTPEVCELFHEVLEPYGIGKTVLRPVYGMAEITLTATLPLEARQACSTAVDRQILEQQARAVPPQPDAAEQRWTAVGQIMPGQEVQIVDEQGVALAERGVGRILLASPSLYLAVRDGESVTPREGKWHDTGDLGFMIGDELYITGRRREIIIKNGRNMAPERIEELAATLAGVDRGAAFGCFDERRQSEKAVLAVEVAPKHLREASQRDALRMALRKTLNGAGYEIDEFILVPRGSLPRTTSGKIRRGACKLRYAAGEPLDGAQASTP